MNTCTHTYTETDIRKVFENFQADLCMLALRTQAMRLEYAKNCVHDIFLMAKKQCLKEFHVQLCDRNGNIVRAHKYSVQENVQLNSQRPGANKWPCLPDGYLHIIVYPSDQQILKNLQESNWLKIHWTDSSFSTDYSGMQGENDRLYSSNGYGLQRETFISY